MLDHAARRPQAAALREKVYGIWQTTSWSELALLVRHMACGLAEAGLQRGEHLVVVGENRPRLYAAMLAAQALGAIPVPLYQDAVAAEYVFPITNAEVRFAIVEDQEQVDKLLELRPQCPAIARIWYDDPRGLRNYSEPGLAAHVLQTVPPSNLNRDDLGATVKESLWAGSPLMSIEMPSNEIEAPGVYGAPDTTTVDWVWSVTV